MSIISKNETYANISSKSEKLFGFPTFILPKNNKELAFFIVFIIFNVIFEELISKQFLFISFNSSFNFRGDIILICSSFMFSIVHNFSKIKDFFLMFILGLLLGKIFQQSENIVAPIFLHLVLNSTIIILAYKRIKGEYNKV
jgi:membrane protease YdiL (CAAX protease family)